MHLTKVTKMDEFFGLVFKAMKNDTSVARVIAFLKRMLQMSFINEASFTAASLLIFSEILRIRKDVRLSLFSFGTNAEKDNGQDEQKPSLMVQNSDDDDEEERFQDVDKVTEQQVKEQKE